MPYHVFGNGRSAQHNPALRSIMVVTSRVAAAHMCMCGLLAPPLAAAVHTRHCCYCCAGDDQLHKAVSITDCPGRCCKQRHERQQLLLLLCCRPVATADSITVSSRRQGFVRCAAVHQLW
jgi:hypothetical protein